jgi:hypothetical protein
MRTVGEKYCAAQIGERGDLNSVAALRRVFFTSAAPSGSGVDEQVICASRCSSSSSSAVSTVGHFWVAVDTARAVGDRVCGQVALQDKGAGAGELRRMAVREPRHSKYLSHSRSHHHSRICKEIILIYPSSHLHFV